MPTHNGSYAVLVTGSAGQLGRALQATFHAHGWFIPYFYSKSALDITDPAQIEYYIQKHAISYIINCAACTTMDAPSEAAATRFYVNSHGPLHLAMLAEKYAITLVHLSTDYVFAASESKPLLPYAAVNPLNAYGQSKWMGEQFVLKYASRAYIIRTAWLYGEQGENFFTRLIQKAAQGQPIEMTSDQMGSPTYVYDLAHALWWMLACISKEQENYYPFAIYHYTNKGAITWYDFACAILSGLPYKVPLIARSSYLDAIRRPSYSVLDTTSFRNIFQIKIPHWRYSLSVCLQRWKALVGASCVPYVS